MQRHEHMQQPGEARAQKSRVWRWRNAVSASDLGATAKHILLQLSHNMDGNGGSCFPTIAELCESTGRSKKTVLKHLRVAEDAGWIDIRQGRLNGQRWRRLDYVARWPDSGLADAPTGEKVVEMASEAGGNEGSKVVEELHQDKISSNNISDNFSDERAGAGEPSQPDRRKVERAFRRWYPTWPRFADYSDATAKRVWFSLSDRERADCIALTPAYIAAQTDGHAFTSPAVYLRKRRWQDVQVPAAEPLPERLHAPFGGPLWMAWWLWQLLQPPTGRIVLTATEQAMIRDGKISHEALLRDKRRRHGWPKAVAMLEAFQAKHKFHAPSAMKALSDGFVAVLPDSPIFAAWVAAHERRDWPFPDPIGKVIYFPPVQDLAGNLHEEVEAAIAGFEKQARGLF